MSDELTDRRTVLKTTGAALAGLTGVSLAGNAAACPGCGGGGSDAPSVTTDMYYLDGNRVTVNGYISTGSTTYADAWFEWGLEGDGLPNDTYLQYTTGGSFCDGYDSDCPNDSFGSLSSGTYEYRAVGHNDYGRTEGSIRTFTI